jgi:CheY-specific phosphatase CheX
MPEESQLLISVFSEILEQFAFMFADSPDEEDVTSSDDRHILTSVGFSGPRKGRIHIAAPYQLCAELGANFLGTDPESLSEESAMDSLKELTNVFIGKFLEQLMGDEVIFDLEVPTMQPLSEEEWKTYIEQPGAVKLVVETYLMALKLEISEAS